MLARTIIGSIYIILGKFINKYFFYTDLSRRNSLEVGDHPRESEFVVLKERKLVPIQPVFNGMLRFSFLL